MLKEYNDPRATLQLIKGNFQEDQNGSIIKEKQGWMIMGANKEQFKNEFRVTVEGIEILIPQEQLHSEVNGKIINYTGTWWEIL